MPSRQRCATLGALWLSNEGARILPELAAPGAEASFLLVKDGEEILARSDPHGA